MYRTMSTIIKIKFKLKPDPEPGQRDGSGSSQLPSMADPERFDADPDTDPTFYTNADSDSKKF